MAVSRDHYYRLSSDLETERISAAVALINELTEAKDEGEWEYAITRLINGLSSSRGSSRLGFSTCLQEIISIRISDGVLSIKGLIELVNTNTKVASSMNGKEERAVLFGKLFGLQALSKFVAEIGNSKLSITEEEFKLFVDNLVELACLKSWIREPSLFTITGIIRSANSIPDELLLYVFTKIDDASLSLTTEGLSLYLSVSQSFRTGVLQKTTFKNKTWSHSDPLDRSNLQILTKVLKDISSGESSDTNEKGSKNTKKKGSWSPRLHFVWPILIENLTSSNEESIDEQVLESKKRKKSSDKKNKKHKNNTEKATSEQLVVSEFWKVIIDESFFNEKASHERKYWGFEIFELLFQAAQPQDTSALFSQNFMRTLINQSSDNNRLLNKIAKKTLSQIVEVSSLQPAKIIPALKELLIGDFGSLQFDRLTKTKTTEQLINLPETSNKEVSGFFISSLDASLQLKDDDAFKTQKWIIDQLLHLVRAKKSVLSKGNDFEWVDTVLKSLLKIAYFKSSADTKEEETQNTYVTEGSDPLVEFAQERLNSILSDVISIERTDNQTWSYKALTSLLDLIEAGSTPILQFDEELNTVKDKSLKTLKKIRAIRESSKHVDTSRLLAFELLFSMLVLQLFAGDAESVNTLQELQDYYHDSKKNSRQEESSNNDQENVIGLVEILLNFISQKSSLLKKLSLIVWENFCEKVDLGGLELLFDIITTKENKDGQRALFEGEDEFAEDNGDSSEDDDDEHEDEHEHAHSHTNGNRHAHEHEHEHEHAESNEDQESDEASESDSESDAEDEEDDENDEDDKEDSKDLVEEVEKKTNVALAEALKVKYQAEEDGDSEDDDDDFSDDSMDDEQMMEIDDQLSKIFKHRREALDTVQTGNKRKQEVEEARSNILLFKHRVVDFIEIFVKKNPQSELVIFTVVPLLTGLRLTLDKALGVKIHKLLKNRICKSKVELHNIEKEELIQILHFIQKDLLRSSNTNDFNLSSSQCSIFISKQLLQLDEGYIDEVVDIYAELMKSWWKKGNSKLTSSIFFDFVNWLNSKRSNQSSK